jgi:predicted nucleotidyltransferase
MAHAGILSTAPADAQGDVARGVAVLRAGGCREVYVFGSVADGRAGPGSDIDFGVRGCPPGQFYALQGKLLLTLSRPADLVDLDVDADLTAFLEREAVSVRVA